MKVLLKRCIFFISVFYFVLSLMINICFYVNTTQKVKELEFPNSNEIKEEVVNIPSNTSINNLMQINACSEKLEVIYCYFGIAVVSTILGTLVAMCTMLKENSKVKFVIIFIVGNIIVNLFYTFLSLYIFKNNGIELGFIGIYIDTAQHLFIPYTIFYLIFLMIRFIDIKIKIKKINNTIKKS